MLALFKILATSVSGAEMYIRPPLLRVMILTNVHTRIEMQYFELFRAKFRVRPMMSAILAICVHILPYVVVVLNGTGSVVWSRYLDNCPTLHSSPKI